MTDTPIAVDASMAAACVMVPGEYDHKYTRGVAGIVAGSVTYPGAALLACAGAEGVGPGMIRLDAPEVVQHMVVASHPGVVLAGGRIQAGLVGPGMDEQQREANQDLAEFCLESALPLVVDAGALPFVATWMKKFSMTRVVLTPHAGEAAQLAGHLGMHTSRESVEKHPSQTAQMLAERTGAHVLVKGSMSYIATPSGRVFVVGPGIGWSGVAGSGDVLSGVLVGLLATWNARAQRSASFHEVVAAGVWIHAQAGRVASEKYGSSGGPVSALTIAQTLPGVIGALAERRLH